MDATEVECAQTRVYIERRDSRQYLFFEFHGEFSAEEAVRAVADWDAVLARHPGRWIYVWDTLDMQDYAIAARHAWQDALGRHRASIEQVVLVTERSSFRIGARIMSSFLRLPMTVVTRRDQVYG